MDWAVVGSMWESMRSALTPALEIALIAFLIYKVLYFMRGTRGAYILAGLITLLIGLSILADILKFQVINWMIEGFWAILATAVIVIFQPELRRAFAQMGTFTFQRGKRQREVISEIVIAAEAMARRKCGALIVIERNIGMRNLEEDAVKLDIRISGMVLESIFFPKSPLHDGAVIIRDNRIVAARVILPLPRSISGIPTRLGTRHRAAIGISEETDAIVVTVSEETGIISVCHRGEMKRPLTPAQLESTLEQLFMLEKDDDEEAEAGALEEDDDGMSTGGDDGRKNS